MGNGRIGGRREKINVLNVYTPCDDRRKKEVWDELSRRISCLNREGLCVIGDFNAIRCEEERRGSAK